MENIIDRLILSIDQKKNPCIVGLDSDFDKIPDFLKKRKGIFFEGIKDTIIEFNKLTIDAIKDIVPAVKIQIAFYEQYGIEGLKAFKETIKYAKENGLMVIGDVKRGDIGNTAKAYALAYSSSDFEVDFITINPYLGSDSISPFIEVCEKRNKGIFILVKTSNPSSVEIQDQITSNGKKIYEKIAEYIDKIGKDLKGEKKYSCIGAVVGATHSEDAKALRCIMPNNFFFSAWIWDTRC
ncbi:MAG: orotidine-5'-phosphate decarboxylase [bacterium]